MHVERKILRVSQRAADSLRDDWESASARVCGRAKNDRRVGAGSDAEGARGIRGDARRQTSDRDLDIFRKAVQRVNGNRETLTRAALRHRD